MATKRKNLEDFIHRMKRNSRNGTGPPCRFEDVEMESLVEMFKKLCGKNQKMDRTTFRDELQTRFKITDDFLMDRIFRAFDKDNDGYLKQDEWIWGLHVFLRGDLEDKIKFCFIVFDVNGDGHISREEMFHLLKKSLVKFSSEEDTEEGVKELVEIMVKKMDFDHDNRISPQDFQTAINQEPLLLEALGTCLPDQAAVNAFLSLLNCNVGHGGMMKMQHRNSGGKGQDETSKKM